MLDGARAKMMLLDDHAVDALRDNYAAICEQVREMDRAYYCQGEPVASDEAYDILKASLVRFEQQHPELLDPYSPTHLVGGGMLESVPGRKVAHTVPMQSLRSVRGGDEAMWAQVAEWLDDVYAEYVSESSSCSPLIVETSRKLDGVAVELRYEHGRLVRALTRGDGRYGRDVTGHMPFVRGVPLRLVGCLVPELLEVRGELIVRRLSSHYDVDKFVTPRSAVMSWLQSHHPERYGRDAECVVPKVEFFAHGTGMVHGACAAKIKNSVDMAALCAGLGIRWVPGRVVMTNPALDDVVNAYKDISLGNSPDQIWTDGVVVSVCNYNLRAALGQSRTAPRWELAIKWAGPVARTRVLSISTPQRGKQGRSVPVAVLEPVEVGGATVRRCSLHSAAHAKALGVVPGARVVVEMVGNTTPQIVEVV